jgi:signal transduction histidine kinase/CheY-like chemotaxis protein
LHNCISGWCMLHRQNVAIADIYADARIPHDAYRPTFVQSLAMVPIRRVEPIGAIGAYWAKHHAATENELEILNALGDSAAMVFANVQLIADLEAANQRKDHFLSMLAHELRNPLAPIRNAIEILQLGSGDAKRVERVRDIMERQVQHLSRIIDGLLDVSRITRGKIQLHRSRIDFGRLIRQAVEDYRGVMESSRLTVHIHTPETPVWINGDRTRLVQVIGNLLDNSRKFTPPDGHVTISLTVDAPLQQAILRIQDTGIGIDAHILPHIFDVFAQADRSLDRARGGLGLGLSVVQGLVTLHDGTISAASPGSRQGAEFTIRLPYEHELPALSDATLPTDPVKHGMRVLVVEDNPDSAESLKMLLEACGFDVVVAYTGPDGVTAAETTHPQIILCDIGLPGMDGFAVANALRHNPEMSAVRLIAITGYDQEEDRHRSLQAGFDVHLVKPVKLQHLLRHLSLS